MGSLAVFAGTFDPLTNGHVDIITRSLKVFERLYVTIPVQTEKKPLFTLDERIGYLRDEFAGFGERVQVSTFSGLLVDYVKSLGGRVIIRGLRAISDYDYEAQMALMNRNINEEVETLFMITSVKNSYISSSIVKQVASLGGNVSKFVPPKIEQALIKRIKEVSKK